MEAGAGADPFSHDFTTAIGHATDAGTTRAAPHAFAWTALFIFWHGYWALGGDFGFGDQESGFPDAPSVSDWLSSAAVSGMFVAGLAVPLAVIRDLGPRRLLVGLLWAGAAVLLLAGSPGLSTTRSASAGWSRPASPG